MKYLIHGRHFQAAEGFAGKVRAKHVLRTENSAMFLVLSQIQKNKGPLTAVILPISETAKIKGVAENENAEMGIESGSCDDNGYFASVLACRPDGDLNVLAQGHEKAH